MQTGETLAISFEGPNFRYWVCNLSTPQASDAATLFVVVSHFDSKALSGAGQSDPQRKNLLRRGDRITEIDGRPVSLDHHKVA